MAVICIDAGHGGKDPGAVGNGLREKDVVWGLDHDGKGGLGMANRIAHYVRKLGHTTYLTREADEYIMLATRAKDAVNAGCDLFVSVHANAGGGTGIEAYIHPSARHAEGALAADMLKTIAALPESKGMRNRGVKCKRFAVLAGTYRQMPAVLLELPFIDHWPDWTWLADRYWRDAAAKAIAESIRKFLG